MCKKNPHLNQSEVVEQLPAACADEAVAVAFMEQQRWGDSPCCPHCGCTDVYRMTDRATGQRNARFLWKCRTKPCAKMFSFRTGTVYAESLIPAHKWCRAFWESATCKNGISALELTRKIQITYKSALFMLHRIRHAMQDNHAELPKLTDNVEADETYCGGRHRRRNNETKSPFGKKFSGKGTKKIPVAAVIQRGGKVRARVIANVDSGNVRQHLLNNVDTSARVMTDQERAYASIGKIFTGGHQTVNHGKKEYVRGDVHTNTAENFFSRVKRSLNGTFHAVSPEHLHRYVAQWEFLHNSRELCDGERVVALMRKADGKRLMYRDPTAA